MQLSRLPRLEGGCQPALSRGEYLRLLQTARALEDEGGYLLVKVFATMGLSTGELSHLTVEAARAGCVEFPQVEDRKIVRIPGSLQRELLAYAGRKGRSSGPLFLTRNGHLPGRSRISARLRALCRAAQVPEEKGNPRCLRRFYQVTMADVEAGVRLLAEQAYDRMLEAEQVTIGWETVERPLTPYG